MASLDAALRAPDRWARVNLMADVMKHSAAGPDGACRMNDLRAAGFTAREIFAYADDARAIISGRPDAGRSVATPAQAEAKRLVAKARRIRRKKGGARSC